jgi:hypothetical protein
MSNVTPIGKRNVLSFRLVPDRLSEDTFYNLHQLYEEAKRGGIVGLAYVAMYKNRTFITDTAGECRRNPVFARGLLLELDDELSQRTKK